MWLAASTIAGVGVFPIGPALTNPGSPSVDLHAVTIVGLVVLLLALIAAVIAAADAAARESR